MPNPGARMVAGLCLTRITVTKLECMGILNNTYIIYTSDNGFKLGQHNIPQEKWTYYEEDV